MKTLKIKILKPAALVCAAALAACAHTGKPAAPPAATTAAQQTHAVTSRYGFDETVRRIEAAVQAKGLIVFTVIDHQAAAKRHGLAMQPAKVIIFGNPKIGTPLMVKDPQFALKLPLRVLVTENGGRVQAVFHDTRALIEGSRLEPADIESGLSKAETLLRRAVTE